MSAPSSARAVLREPFVPLVLAASQVGRLPLGAGPLALLLFARQSSSLAAAGALVAVFTAGMAVGAPVLARAVDRWRQPPVLYGSTALSTAGYLTAAHGDGRPAVIAAGAALAGLGTPPLEACLRALAGGALLGGLAYTRATPGGPGRLPLLAAGFAAGYLPLLLVPGPAPMAVLQAVSGVMLPPMLTAVFLAADRLAPTGTAVEAFAWIMTAFSVGSAAGAALAGPLTAAGVRTGFALAPVAGLLAVAALAATVRERRERR